MRDDDVPRGNPLCVHKHAAEIYCSFMYELDNTLGRCDGYNAKCAGYLPKENLAFKPINHVYATRLVDALKIYYYMGDEEINRLAENAFSGCAGTQRENQYELRDFLKETK